ncbi:MAG: phage tail protein [Bacillota bacterium]
MNKRLNAIVGARVAEFKKKMADVKKTLATIPQKTKAKVIVSTKEAEKRIGNFQRKMDRLSATIHSLSNVGANMFQGGLLMMSPSIVPILAAAVGLLGSLGPMIGTIAGSTFALATAFGFAGMAALAFGGAAIPVISKLFNENEKLTKSQKAAKAELTKLQNTWKGITKDLEKPILEAFGKSMQFANKVLKVSEPLFKSAATAVNNLLDSLNQSLDSGPVKAFFNYMNKNAGPMLETTGKAMGNLMQGFMNMMTAFGPLAEKTAQGFLNMSQGFADWAAGLSKSDKFQSFVSYISENMPKIRSIFRDATAGLVYMFSAFAPLSSDMMTSLQGMMARFKEWGRTLGENQQFQKFIGYIRTNAPTVISLIGNLITFLVNMGIAIAPIGSKVLELVNAFVGWTGSMVGAHPVLGQMIAVLLMGIGAFQMMVPAILAITSLFPGLGAAIITQFKNIGTIFSTSKLLLTTGLKQIGVQFALFASRAATMATRVVTQFLLMTKQGAVWVAKFTAQVAVQIRKWALLGAKAVAHAAKVALTFTVTMVKAAATGTAFVVASMAKFAAKYAWLGVQALVHAAKVAASWFIALGPVGWVTATVIALVALIIANWSKVKSWTVSAWNSTVSAIKLAVSRITSSIRSGLNKALSFVKGLGKSFYNAGKGFIDMMAKGITNAVGKVTSAVKSVASKVRNFLPFSPAKEGPLSDLDKLNFGGPIKDSIAKAKRSVQNSMSSMLAMDSQRLAFDASVNSADFGRIQHTFGAEISEYEKPDPVINVYNEWDGEKVVSYVERGSAKRSRITDGFYGK